MASEAGAGAKRKRIDWRATGGIRKRFIACLAATYDVEAACAAAGVEWPIICELRVRHPDFAAAFEEVIAAGYDRLEAMLLRRAGAALAEAEGAGDVQLATNLLKQRRSLKAEPQGMRPGRRPGSRTAPARGADRKQLIQSIMNALAPPGAASTRGDGEDDQERAPVSFGRMAEPGG